MAGFYAGLLPHLAGPLPVVKNAHLDNTTKMWKILITVLAVLLLFMLIGGCSYTMAAPAPRLCRSSKRMTGSTLSRDKDVPKAGF
jgi:hypothetical protein